MYLKLILCYVKKENQAEYTLRQAAWDDIKNVDGLIFQLGGWNTKDEEIACKLALWESEQHYSDFHLNIHDSLAAKAGHQHLYYKIETAFFNIISPFSSGVKLQAVLQNSSFVRLADCWVKHQYIDIFLAAQKDLWIPAMQNTTGMQGGFFSQNSVDNERFLVSSFWENEFLHEEYTKNILPQLRNEAKVKDTINEIKGYYFKTVPLWTAIGHKINSYYTWF